MNATQMGEALREFLRNGIGVPVFVLALLAMLVLPLPPLALDMLFTFNIALSLIVLLVTVYILRPLDFSVFPSLLLVATLLRLALNVASTRVVLLKGNEGTDAAGRVIEAFGEFVVGGNYAVGLVVFAILTIINFVVVTKGAGRVSEVSARFTLDAMPGKQMAIDADLNAGILTQEEARERRAEVAREADFYGAMDGASKFVRGDAIAGLLILFINLIGGLAIGTLQYGMEAGEAARTFSLLAIGDGLVAQLPSLLLSTASAIVVTRVSGRKDMGSEVLGQLLSTPRALFVSSGIVGLLGLIPGMPNFAFLSLAGGLGWAGWRQDAQARLKQSRAAVEQHTASPEPVELSWNDVQAVDPLGIEVGYRLIPLVDRAQGGPLLARIRGVRKKLSQELGFLVPSVHIRDNLDLPPNGYRVLLSGVVTGEAQVWSDKELAINPGRVYGEISGIATRDPAFGLEAVWITPEQREQAQTLGYTVVDAGTVIATHLSQIIGEHAHQLLGHEEAQQLLDRLARQAPKLVEDLVPKALTLGAFVRVLQHLLNERVAIRDLRTIAEVLAEHAPGTQDPVMLTAAVRSALGGSIIQQINGISEDLEVMTLDPGLERILQQAVQGGPGGSLPALEPGLAERLSEGVREAAGRQEAAGRAPVLVVGSAVRSWLARLLRPAVPGLNVLAYAEIPERCRVKVAATVGRA